MSTIVLRWVGTGGLRRAAPVVRAYRRCRFHSEPIYGTGQTQAVGFTARTRTGRHTRRMRRQPGGQPGTAAASARPGEVLAPAAAAHRSTAQGAHAQRRDRLGARCGADRQRGAVHGRGVPAGRRHQRQRGRGGHPERRADEQGAGPVREARTGRARDQDLEEGTGARDRQVGVVHDEAGDHLLTSEGIYVRQCGDPTATGTGGPGYTIPDENLKDKSLKDNIYPAGTVAMANTGQKDSGGSQFFLVYQDSQLPPNYTPFGTVSKPGMEVLNKIAAAGATAPDPTTGNTAPHATVVIDKATVTES